MAQQRKDADGEGDVRGHRHAPAVAGRALRVQEEIDQRGHQHAPEGRGNRQSRAPRLGQLPLMHLAPDLQADDEEEDDHQSVVDQEADRVRKGEASHADRHGRLPQPLIEMAQGEFAQTSAAMAATSSTMPLAAWMDRKRSTGLTMCPARRRAGADTSGGTGGREESRVVGSAASCIGFETAGAAASHAKQTPRTT